MEAVTKSPEYEQVIEGKYGKAVCFAKTIEEAAVNQIRRMCYQEFCDGVDIRIMPDVHAGAGCTIGTVMTVKDKVVPNIVGVDIGCGMYTVALDMHGIGGKKGLLKLVDNLAHEIPSGRNVWEKPTLGEEFLDRLRCRRALRDVDWLLRSMGTLGGGNHFIEMDIGSGISEPVYLVVHSGSRNLGKQVAEHYQRMAVRQRRGDVEREEKRDELIASYKAQGREKELQGALEALKEESFGSDIPEDLCWLEGELLDDYLRDMDICQSFAKTNREMIAHHIIEGLGVRCKWAKHTVHNYIDLDRMIIRKGAISAEKMEKVLIPINMRDGSILAIGKGNPDWLWSAPHGAGRIMSRAEARRKLSMDEYEETMKGIFTTSLSLGTIDEAPMAYRGMDEILGAIGDTVEVVDILKPVWNFKAGSEASSAE